MIGIASFDYFYRHFLFQKNQQGYLEKRIETPSYPGNSLREIVLNAFCHTNYFIRSNIKVEFYRDKAKITSPGGLYKTTLEDMLKGVQTYRNERLVHLLDKLGLIENYGTGIPRTLNAYKGTGKEPEFYDSENFFIVYLPNLNYRDQINDCYDKIVKWPFGIAGMAAISAVLAGIMALILK